VKIAVCHHFLEIGGGGERLTISMIEALVNRQHEVNLVLIRKPKDEVVQRLFGKKLEGVEISTLVPFGISIFSLYQKLFSALPLVFRAKNADLLFVANTLVPYEIARRILNKRTILFVHTPPVPESNSVPPPYDKRLLGKIYYYGSLFLRRRIRRFPPDADLILCNSTFTKQAVRKVWGLNAKVVFPPVSVTDFYGDADFSKRGDYIVSVGRIAPEKRIEHQVEAISRTPYRLKVVGSTLLKLYGTYYDDLRRKISSAGLRDRVSFETNVPFKRLRLLLSNAKIYVHTMLEEHFGISIVEAMASGCPVIMHKSGGAWTDIAGNGKYAMGYQTPKDLARKIQKLMRDQKEWEHWHNKSLERAKEFDESVFQKRIVEEVDKFCQFRKA
jgi:alpha-1,2-mannosyltransferase